MTLIFSPLTLSRRRKLTLGFWPRLDGIETLVSIMTRYYALAPRNLINQYFLEMSMAIPRCPYFGKCGGCTGQHIDYNVQLENKRVLLWRAVRDHLKIEDVKAFSGEEYNYRNRMDFAFVNNSEDQIRQSSAAGLGLREKGKWHSIVDIKRCEISEPALNSLLAEVRDFFSARETDVFNIRESTGTFRYAVIRVTSSGDSSISFVINEDSGKRDDAMDIIKEFAEQTAAKNVLVILMPHETDMSIGEVHKVIKGSDMLQENLLGKAFYYSSQGFFQNNSAMAAEMQKYCNELLKRHAAAEKKENWGKNGEKEKASTQLLDLYAGVGTFGVINASLFRRVTMVESVPQCIEAMKRNCEENDVKNADAVLLDAAKLSRLAPQLTRPLYVMTDPPRSGMSEKTIIALKRLKPKVMIYISCNLLQLAKDIPKFKDYSVRSAALFDLFPQTLHAEGIVEMELKL